MLHCNIRLAAVRARGVLCHVSVGRRPRHVVTESQYRAHTGLTLLASEVDCLRAPRCCASPALRLRAAPLACYCSARIQVLPRCPSCQQGYSCRVTLLLLVPCRLL